MDNVVAKIKRHCGSPRWFLEKRRDGKVAKRQVQWVKGANAFGKMLLREYPRVAF